MPANSMNVINFNRRQLPQRDKFKKSLGGYNAEKKAEYNFPKATPKQLRDIRQKLKKENQILWIKNLGITAILIIGFVWVLLTS